jgi:hypothetical protein
MSELLALHDLGFHVLGCCSGNLEYFTSKRAWAGLPAAGRIQQQQAKASCRQAQPQAGAVAVVRPSSCYIPSGLRLRGGRGEGSLDPRSDGARAASARYYSAPRTGNLLVLTHCAASVAPPSPAAGPAACARHCHRVPPPVGGA